MLNNEIQRTAHAINDLRPDWPISSLTTFITKQLANRPYRDVVVALAWVATDTKLDGTPASDTPKRVLEAGPWWNAATAHDGKPRGNFPPKAHEQCPRHPGQWADNCGPCLAPKPWDGADMPAPRAQPGDTEAGAQACRALLRGEA